MKITADTIELSELDWPNCNMNILYKFNAEYKRSKANS